MTATRPDAATVRAALAQVRDPEIPELSVLDLGIVRSIDTTGAGRVVITPTYSGCPAYEVIERDVRHALSLAGLPDAQVCKSYYPPWTTDWLSADARKILREIGIAPPHVIGEPGAQPVGMYALRKPACPRCGSADVQLTSEFGPTACKALFVCRACREPFEHFKPL